MDFEESKNPEIEINLKNKEVQLGGLLKGTFKITGVGNSTQINQISINLIQNEDDEEEVIGEITIPYLGYKLKKDEIIQEEFEIQNLIEYVKPSSNKISHQLNLSIDCEDITPEMLVEFKILDKEAELAREEFNEYFYIDGPMDFLYSSVRGELRIFGFDSGFVISWNDRISVRNNDGSLRWRIIGPGRSVAINPDSNKLITSWENGDMISLYDLNTGDLLRVEPLDSYIDQLVWYEDNSAIIAGGGENDLFKLDTSGKMIKKLKVKNVEYIDSMIQVPGEQQVYITDTNGSQLVFYDTNKQKVKQIMETYNTSELAASNDYSMLALADRNGFTIIDRESIEPGELIFPIIESETPGKSGVRYIGQEEGSCRAWEIKLRFNPDNNRFLINVLDGQVWLINIEERKKTAIPREVINFVEDTYWINKNKFAAIDSMGYLSIIEVESWKVLFKELDYER